MGTLEDEGRPLLRGVSNKAAIEYIVLASLSLSCMEESMAELMINPICG